MSPQYDALVQIAEEDLDWLNPDHHRRLRETTERLKRYLDDIDVSKENALVLQDDLKNRAAQETNKTIYMLSIVAAIFLPLGFLTGLLGINVGGMPGVDTPTAFWVVVVLLIGVMALQYYLFKKLKWIFGLEAYTLRPPSTKPLQFFEKVILRRHDAVEQADTNPEGSGRSSTRRAA
ncbi:MAG: CorA family divalent cation transporter, partial [Pseudomonadota bacterium]